MRRVLSVAAALAMASGAQAADLGGVRVPAPAEVTASTGLWHGFYAGLHAGWGRGRSVYDPLIIGSEIKHSYSGALVGGQFGWNYQVGQFVLGLEATFAYSTLSGGVPSPPLLGGATIRTNLNWLATMGPRLGVAVDRALVYGKGGFAMAGVRTGPVDPVTDEFRGPFARAGWFLGGGVEYAFAPNWSARVEYNYLNFGSGMVMFLYFAPAGVATPAHIDAHTVTVGVNYRFGGGRQAEVAAGTVSGWTGFYAGFHAGHGSGNTTYVAAFGGQIDHQFTGLLAGGQFGWNYQVNRFVFGAEATLAYAGLSGQGEAFFTPIRTRMQWLATMGPRFGVAVDRALLYGKGGFAAAGMHGGADFALIAVPSAYIRSGWFLGAGVEYAFAPNWSAKAEYNYVHLGNGPAIFANNFGFIQTADAKLRTHTVTLGVNYHFTTGPGAIVARY